MNNSEKILKLLNLTSSTNDAEALSALRLAQKLLEHNLGDYLSQSQGASSDAAETGQSLYEELEKLFEAEVDKVHALKKQLDDKDKSLRKRERDVQNLKREVKGLEDKLEASERTVEKLSASAREPGLYEDLEAEYETQVEKTEKLQRYLDEKDKAVKKNMRDVTQLKREVDANERQIEKLEKTVDELTEELMAYKQAGRGN